MPHQKLELTWVGKDEPLQLEPRILVEQPAYSYGEAESGNMLIHGDNLLALKALELEYAGKVKCIYIDPPYNTGSAFEHYEDGLEHSQWLNLMRPRLELLRNLLREDGSIWISIDDNECHYLKVLCDEVFGRKNFVANVIWRKVFAPKNSARHLSVDHDYVLVFAKNGERFIPNQLPMAEKTKLSYKNLDNDPRGLWSSSDLSARNPYSLGIYQVVTPSGRVIEGPPPGTYWRVSQQKLKELDADNRIWWGKDGSGVPRLKRFISEIKEGRVPQTFWSFEEVGHNQDAKKESVSLFGDNIFDTPKPEKLLERIFTLASNPGDLVLDSFLGSGTTAAVAHKMGRRWIGIELGQHAYTHCYPRMRKVVDGEQGGISKSLSWQGGGGFRFYTLAPTLVLEDELGQPIINPEYNATMLAAAMARHEGFRFQPNGAVWWQQGQSGEQDFICTTTQFVTTAFVAGIVENLRPEQSLLICCKAYEEGLENRFPQVSVKKIPQMLLNRCEFGAGEAQYQLPIVHLPEDPEAQDLDQPEEPQEFPESPEPEKADNPANGQLGIF